MPYRHFRTDCILQKVAAKNNRVKSMAKIPSTANTGSTSYSFGNDIVRVDGLAVASRQFNVPKQFKLESATIGFTNDSKKLPIKVDIEMSWKKPQRYDVDIEAGAYYNGKWGGSKFRVIKN